MNWRRPAFLLAHDLIGSGLRAHYQEFLQTQRREQLQVLQTQRLETLLQHAKEEVPYYRERVLRPELSAFPILRKEDVLGHFEQLMEPSLLAEYRGEKPKARYSWVEVKTGGSTGTPTVVIHDKNFRDWGRAGRLFSQHLCGFPLGSPFFMLWGSMRDIDASRESAQKRLLNALLNVHPLNAFLMDEARMDDYARQINESSIDHLMAYVDAADQLARYAEKRGIAMRRLESVMACAGTVTEEHRLRLGRVFGARVHNKYGSRECADMACECAAGGFHIYATGVHLEIVDEAGQPVPVGTSGRILVTLLHNRRFPMIRYEIGDIGALSTKACPCGSPLPLLESVTGRISEIITATHGAFVSPIYIRHLIGVVHNPGPLEKFQFTQHSASTYSLALQFDQDFSQEKFAEVAGVIERDLKSVLGADADLTISRVENIALSASGKFLYVRNLHQSK